MVEFRDVRRAVLLPDQIAADIMAKIADGELTPGDILPTEHRLADTFGVSRNVVREAIARLRSDGVVESRQGRGAVVMPVSERETFRVDIRSLGKSENLADLFELRGILEIEAAGLAAERRSCQDLEDLQTAHALMDSETAYDDICLEADADFHRVLGKASGNTYLFAIICYISSRLKESTRRTTEIYARDNLLLVTLSEHGRILASIEAGDKTAARAAMEAHIRSAANRLSVPLKYT